MTRLVHLYCQAEFMPTVKIALITGITGQDGSYLAELLEKGCQTRDEEAREQLQHDPDRSSLSRPSRERSGCSPLWRSQLNTTDHRQVQPERFTTLCPEICGGEPESPEYTANSDALASCGFWRRLRSWGSPTKLGSIKPARVSSTAWFRRSHKTRPRRFIHVAPMELPSSMPTG